MPILEQTHTTGAKGHKTYIYYEVRTTNHKVLFSDAYCSYIVAFDLVKFTNINKNLIIESKIKHFSSFTFFQVILCET